MCLIFVLFEDLDYFSLCCTGHEISFFFFFAFGLGSVWWFNNSFVIYLFSRPIHIRIQCDPTLFFHFAVSTQVFLLSKFDLSKAFCRLFNSVLPSKMCEIFYYILAMFFIADIWNLCKTTSLNQINAIW